MKSNRRTRHDYFIEETLEASLVLQGWEVKSLRTGKVNLSDSYVIIKQGEALLLGCTINPLHLASTHVICYATRTRKLLLSCIPCMEKSTDKVIRWLPSRFIGKVPGAKLA